MRQRRSLRSSRGAVLVEYPIILAAVVVAAVFALGALVDVARRDYTATGNGIGTAVTYEISTSTSIYRSPAPTVPSPTMVPPPTTIGGGGGTTTTAVIIES